MQYKEVLEVAKFLSRKYKNGAGWVSLSCPFSKWTHSHGRDNHPSFGISIGNPSRFNCFTCGKHGVLMYLPTLLEYYSGKPHRELRELISRYEQFSGSSEEQQKKPFVGYIDKRFYDLFPKFDIPYRSISEQAVELWDLRLDKWEARLLIPIKDKQGNLCAIKGRYVGGLDDVPKYKLYTQLSGNSPTKMGLWFGEHIPIVDGKAVFIVEGELDAIALKQYGVANVLSTIGSNITREQLNRLPELIKGNNVVLFLDNDIAGLRAKAKILDVLHTNIYEVTNYYGCKDASEALEKKMLAQILKSIKRVK